MKLKSILDPLQGIIKTGIQTVSSIDFLGGECWVLKKKTHTHKRQTYTKRSVSGHGLKHLVYLLQVPNSNYAINKDYYLMKFSSHHFEIKTFSLNLLP